MHLHRQVGKGTEDVWTPCRESTEDRRCEKAGRAGGFDDILGRLCFFMRHNAPAGQQLRST
jgi:hypothetical protein